MSTLIMLSGLEAATNAAILNDTRLATVPANGFLSFEMQASDCIAANQYSATIQLPDNSTPLNGVLIPGTATAGLTGILDDRLSLKVRFRITQGGTCLFSCVETGDTEFMWRVTFTPFR